MNEDHATSCPDCAAPFDYRLDAEPGRGLRYDVVCSQCDLVYFSMVPPAAYALPVAA